MTQTELVDNFIELEYKQDFFNLSVDGFQCWPYVRGIVETILWERLIGSFTGELRENPGRSTYSEKMQVLSAGDVLKGIGKAAVPVNFRSLPHKNIVCFADPRRVMNRGVYFDAFNDYVQDFFPEDTLVFEVPYRNKHFYPRYTKGIIDLDNYHVRNYAAKWRPIRRSVQDEFESVAEKICNDIYAAFGVRCSREVMSSNLNEFYNRWKHGKVFYHKLFETVQPKVVFEVCNYSLESIILNEAAHEMGIQTVEFQHGTLNREHYAYNFYDCNRSYKYLPDKVFLYGKYFQENMRFPGGEKSEVVIGDCFLDEMSERYPWKRADKVRVTILSQNYKELYNFTVSCARYFSEHGIDCLLTYKLHPIEYDKPESSFSDLLQYSNVRLVRDASINLYDVLSQSDITISANSTALFESSIYENIVPCIFECAESQSLQNLVDIGAFVGLKSAADLADLVQNIEKFRRDRKDSSYSEYFFRRNARENLKTEIDAMLAE